MAFLGGAINSAVGKVHRVAIEMDHCYELVAGCFSRDAAINARTAIEYGVTADRVYSDLDQVLRQESDHIDAMVILTPTPQHKDQVVTCLSQGIPVICEKALASSVSEGREICDMLTRKKGFLAVTFNYTGYPMLRELRNIIGRGGIGDIEQIHIEMPQEGFARLGNDGTPIVPQDWRLHDRQIPTVSLDLGVHTHSIVSFLTGESPIELASMSSTYGNFGQITDSVSCLAKYSGNITCSMWYGKAALGYRNGLKVRIFGTKGAVEWLQETPEVLLMADNRGRRYILDRSSPDAAISNQMRYTRFKAGHPAGFVEAFANYYQDVAESLARYLEDGSPSRNAYVLGIDEALEGLEMMGTIASASAGKTWMPIPSGI